MNRWIFLSVFLSVPVLAAGPKKTFPIVNFSKGLDTYHDPLTLPDGYVQDALNVYFDKTSPVEKRQGYSVAFTTGTMAFQQSWTYTDPTNVIWIIARSSNVVVANNLNGTTVQISTVSASDHMSEANAFGNAYFIDPTQGVYYWNGTATTYVAGSPKGTLLASYHERLWAAGQAIPNNNVLNGSEFENGTVWATGPNATDPVQFTVGLGDNYDSISGLYSFLNTLYITKFQSIFDLQGFDQTDFQINQVTQECGCIDPNSIQSFNHGMVFVSLRGVEFFDGYTCTRISDAVKNKIDPVTQTQNKSRSWVQTSQADWQAGTVTNGAMDTNSIPGTMMLSTLNNTDNLQDSSLGLIFVNGSLYFPSILNQSDIVKNIPNPTFQSGLSNWTSVVMTNGFNGNNGLCVPSGEMLGPSYSTFNNTATADVAILNSHNGSVIVSDSLPANGIQGDCPSQSFTITAPNSYVNTRVELRFHLHDTTSGGDSYLTSSSVLCNNSSGNTNGCFFPFSYVFYGGPNNYGGAKMYFTVNNITGGQNSNDGLALIYRTNSINLSSIPNPLVLVNSGWTVSTTTPTVLVEQSPDGISNWTTLTTSTGVPVLATKSWIRDTETIDPSSTEDALTSINSISFNVVSDSASWTSQIFNAAGIGGFNNFQVDQAVNSGGTSYAICTSPNSNMSSESCTAQNPNAPIGASVNPYIQVESTFTSSGQLTNNPQLFDFVVNYNLGKPIPPMASAVYDNRYWLSLSTTTSDAFNDDTLVDTLSNAWTQFNIDAGGFSIVKNNLYHGDANATGNFYEDNQGYSDNGNAIDAYIHTKDYAMGDPVSVKVMDNLYLLTENGGPYSLNVDYYVDGSTSPFIMGSPMENEVSLSRMTATLPFPIDVAHQDFMYTISFKFDQDQVNAPFDLLGAYLNYHERPVL